MTRRELVDRISVLVCECEGIFGEDEYVGTAGRHPHCRATARMVLTEIRAQIRGAGL